LVPVAVVVGGVSVLWPLLHGVQRLLGFILLLVFCFVVVVRLSLLYAAALSRFLRLLQGLIGALV
jgi:hypothetical protein